MEAQQTSPWDGNDFTCANVIGPGFWVSLPRCGKKEKTGASVDLLLFLALQKWDV